MSPLNTSICNVANDYRKVWSKTTEDKQPFLQTEKTSTGHSGVGYDVQYKAMVT